ncbi:uncharacterized protein LOC129734007 [Wyeomyia smithii]|uniref:uncharacterized protein LOC129734007 n=1 Tax=Wyeomyia smithii TaxID=174621 RepID=UPI0024681CB3|nr:uncharacterized protein LOC129734007 [Wyeomyia smithii]
MKALSTICLSLEKTNYSLVMDAKNAREAWNKFKTAFQDDGIYRRIGLLRQLTSIRLENYDSTEAYVDSLVSTSHKLLLMGLPKYYAPMVTGLEASGQALKADAVKAKILQDVKAKHGPRSSSDEGAFYSGGAQQQQRRGDGGLQKQKDRACDNCRKVGHYAGNCPKKTDTSEGKKRRAMCAVLAVGNVDQDEWYFDSGDTTHMARPGSNYQAKQEVSYQVGTANKNCMTAKVKGIVNLDCAHRGRKGFCLRYS